MRVEPRTGNGRGGRAGEAGNTRHIRGGLWAEQLEKLCGNNNISLTKGEKIEEVLAQGGWCLIGRIWIGKKVNREAFKTVIQNMAYDSGSKFQGIR